MLDTARRAGVHKAQSVGEAGSLPQDDVERIARERAQLEAKEQAPQDADQLIDATEDAVESLKLRLANNPLAYEYLNTLSSRVLDYLIAPNGEPSAFVQSLVANEELSVDQIASLDCISRAVISELNPLLFQIRIAIEKYNALTQAGARSAKSIFELKEEGDLLSLLKTGKVDSQTTTSLFGVLEGFRDSEQYAVRELVLINPVSELHDNTSYWEEQMKSKQEVTGEEQGDYTELIVDRNERALYELDMLTGVAEQEGDLVLEDACMTVAIFLEHAERELRKDFVAAKKKFLLYDMSADEVLDLLNACERIKQASPELWARMLGVGPADRQGEATRSDLYGNALQILIYNTQKSKKKSRSTKHAIGRQVMQERLKGLCELDTKQLPLAHVSHEQFDEMQHTLKRELKQDAEKQNPVLLVSLVERLTTSASSASLHELLSDVSEEEQERREREKFNADLFQVMSFNGDDVLKESLLRDQEFKRNLVRAALHCEAMQEMFINPKEPKSGLLETLLDTVEPQFDLLIEIIKRRINAGEYDDGKTWPLGAHIQLNREQDEEITRLLAERLVEIGNYEAVEKVSFLSARSKQRRQKGLKSGRSLEETFGIAKKIIAKNYIELGRFEEAEMRILAIDRFGGSGSLELATKYLHALAAAGRFEELLAAKKIREIVQLKTREDLALDLAIGGYVKQGEYGEVMNLLAEDTKLAADKHVEYLSLIALAKIDQKKSAEVEIEAMQRIARAQNWGYDKKIKNSLRNTNHLDPVSFCTPLIIAEGKAHDGDPDAIATTAREVFETIKHIGTNGPHERGEHNRLDNQIYCLRELLKLKDYYRFDQQLEFEISLFIKGIELQKFKKEYRYDFNRNMGLDFVECLVWLQGDPEEIDFFIRMSITVILNTRDSNRKLVNEAYERAAEVYMELKDFHAAAGFGKKVNDEEKRIALAEKLVDLEVGRNNLGSAAVYGTQILKGKHEDLLNGFIARALFKYGYYNRVDSYLSKCSDDERWNELRLAVGGKRIEQQKYTEAFAVYEAMQECNEKYAAMRELCLVIAKRHEPRGFEAVKNMLYRMRDAVVTASQYRVFYESTLLSMSVEYARAGAYGVAEYIVRHLLNDFDKDFVNKGYADIAVAAQKRRDVEMAEAFVGRIKKDSRSTQNQVEELKAETYARMGQFAKAVKYADRHLLRKRQWINRLSRTGSFSKGEPERAYNEFRKKLAGALEEWYRPQEEVEPPRISEEEYAPSLFNHLRRDR